MGKFLTRLNCMLLAFFCINGTLIAQTHEKEINHQTQAWVSINSTSRFSNNWGLIADAHIRRNNFFADPSFYFIRFAANYWVNDKFTLAAGYGHMWVAPTTPGWKTFSNENRIYEQAQLISKAGKLGVLQRLRLEQRWQQKIVNDTYSGNNRFTNRFRYLLSFTIPVSKNPKVPSLVISDEILLHFGKEVVYNTFDQNRLFLGIKQTLSKRWSFDLGYMLVNQQKYSGYQYDENSTFRWFFYYTPDFRHKLQGNAHQPHSGDE